MNDATSRLATALGDRYRIERELGQGGMATVYLAHDVQHDRKWPSRCSTPNWPGGRDDHHMNDSREGR